METIKPYVREEVTNVWWLWKAGIVREDCARADGDVGEPYDRTTPDVVRLSS